MDSDFLLCKVKLFCSFYLMIISNNNKATTHVYSADDVELKFKKLALVKLQYNEDIV